MKQNLVSTASQSPSFLTLIHNPSDIITLDANFFIPPDRSKEFPQAKRFNFDNFKSIWLEPLFNTLPKVAIHEAVYNELLGSSKNYVDNDLLGVWPKQIVIFSDSELNPHEATVPNTIEEKIAACTFYNPSLDNKADRGEVKSLVYIAIKKLLYFCSHDARALRLIDQTEQLKTNLGTVNAIRTYEVIYYLLRKAAGPLNLRPLYKYMYHLTHTDKQCNPSWGDFVVQMDHLYNGII